MPNDKPYIERRYVELAEEVEYTHDGYGNELSEFSSWVAHVNGPASTKEYVQMSRSSQSAGEALLLLTEALEEQGWELR